MFNFGQKRIAKLLKEKRPLPTGMQEFEDWSDRIISGTCLPSTPESQKFALAEMLMHMPPNEDSECDLLFIKKLRKSAVNQIAYAKMEATRNAAKKRLAEQQKLAEATASAGATDAQVLDKH